MFNQTNYPNYMPAAQTSQLLYINGGQDLSILPAQLGTQFFYCPQENKFYIRSNQNGQVKIEEYIAPTAQNYSQIEQRLSKIEQFLSSQNKTKGGEPNWQL